MNLIIENRTDQFATLNFQRADSTRSSLNIRPRSEASIAIPPDPPAPANADGTIPAASATPAALTYLLDELAVYGVVSADGIDAMDAGTPSFAPNWRGWCYRVDGTA